MNTGAQPASEEDVRLAALIELVGRMDTLEGRLDASGMFAMRRSTELRALTTRMDDMESRLSLDVVGSMPTRTRRWLTYGISGICAAAVAVIALNGVEMHQEAGIAHQGTVNSQQILRTQNMYLSGHKALSQEVQKIAQATGAAPKPDRKKAAASADAPAPQTATDTIVYVGRHRGELVV